jgi:hypothetical protein
MEAVPEHLRKELLKTLSPGMAAYGFGSLPPGTFVRQRGGVRDIFQVVILDGKPGYRIQPNVGIRIEKVEDLFHKTSGFEPRYQKKTATMGNSVGAYLEGNSQACEFLLESESDIKTISDKILGVFREFALPFFNQWGSLLAIDKELNDNPTQLTSHRALAWFRCSTGVIVAKLVGRADYEKLVTIYMEAMKADNRGFYLKKFQSLLQSLEAIEADGGPSELL